MHEHIDADVRAFFDSGGGTNPRKINKGKADDFFAPNGGIGENLAAQHFDGHGDHEHHVKQSSSQRSAF